jgi:hypothetical protein
MTSVGNYTGNNTAKSPEYLNNALISEPDTKMPG